jgi:hypothetical protein
MRTMGICLYIGEKYSTDDGCVDRRSPVMIFAGSSGSDSITSFQAVFQSISTMVSHLKGVEIIKDTYWRYSGYSEQSKPIHETLASVPYPIL